jgi:glycosyltransferase involved in cell wall biosynthesis
LGMAPDGPLVLAVGGLTPRKDPLSLIQAIARLRATHPSARLALVGDGPLAAAVDAGARRLGITAAVVRTGAIGHEQIPDWMAACDVLSLVSTVEPLGIVALEALASGRPVVTTSVGGAAEVVPHGRAGMVVDPGRPGKTAAALAQMIDHPPDPDVCRAAAELHSLTRQAEQVRRILETAAGLGGAQDGPFVEGPGSAR